MRPRCAFHATQCGRSDVRTLTPSCDRLEVVSLAESGHYPMQEMPPTTAALVERFLGADTD
jgi:hypothetical protein